MQNIQLHYYSVKFAVIELQADFLRWLSMNRKKRSLGRRTFIAIYTFVGLWRTFFTVP